MDTTAREESLDPRGWLGSEYLLKQYLRGHTSTFSILEWQICLRACGWPLIEGRQAGEPVWVVSVPGGTSLELRPDPDNGVLPLQDLDQWLRIHGFSAAACVRIGYETRWEQWARRHTIGNGSIVDSGSQSVALPATMVEKSASFASFREAWEFMQKVEADGGAASFPSFRPPHLVHYVESNDFRTKMTPDVNGNEEKT